MSSISEILNKGHRAIPTQCEGAARDIPPKSHTAEPPSKLRIIGQFTTLIWNHRDEFLRRNERSGRLWRSKPTKYMGYSYIYDHENT